MPEKLRYVAFGICPKCGRELIRNIECTVGICDCESAIEVPLKPTMLFRTNSRLYKKIVKLTEVIGVPVEEFVSKVYETAINDEAFMEDCLKHIRRRSNQ